MLVLAVAVALLAVKSFWKRSVRANWEAASLASFLLRPVPGKSWPRIEQTWERLESQTV